jgi:hypothetical protein
MTTAIPPANKSRRQMVIRRDGADFVAAFLPENFIIFRHHDVTALLGPAARWEISGDTAEKDFLRAMVMEAVQDRRI